MRINVREDKVEIEGYVNSVERVSNTLYHRTIGKFIERIKKGAFKRALKRNDDVKILLNHDRNRVLGSQRQGNLELKEDNIGLKARATITDKEVVEKARNNELVGWSFGFFDRDVETTSEKGVKLREVFDLDLDEVSILDNTKTPAYDGTLIMTRDGDSKPLHIRNEIIEEETKEVDDIIEDGETTEINEEENLDLQGMSKEEEMEELASRVAIKVVEAMKGLTRDEEEPKEEGSFNVEEKKEEKAEEKPAEEPQAEEQPKQQEIVDKEIDYSHAENLIKEMKEEM